MSAREGDFEPLAPAHPSPAARVNMAPSFVVCGANSTVIVDAEYHQQNLPHSVEAFLFDAEAHRAFLDFYGVSAENYPLVYYQPHTLKDRPFYVPY